MRAPLHRDFHANRATYAKGFTLLEVILVVLLMALAMTLVPRMVGSGVSGAELKSNVRAITAAMRLTRDAAVNTRREAFVTLNVESREVTNTATNTVTRLNEKITLKLFTSQADQINDKTASFRFYPDGSSNGGRVTVIANEREFAIDVDWLTGRVSVTDSAEPPKTSLNHSYIVIPAQAGIQDSPGVHALTNLDSRLRGNDNSAEIALLETKQGQAS
jgi:general secretion pathway protein H